MATFNNNIMSFSGSIQHKRGTAASLAASDYVPAAGEIIVATDTGQVKPGDGSHSWRELPTFGGVNIADSYTETVAGKALDATKGKDLNDRVAVLEGVSGIDCGEISAPAQGSGN